MFSSFPTTRHASDLERLRTTTTETEEDGRGDDLDAHGALTWAKSSGLSRDGVSDAEEEEDDDDNFNKEEEEEEEEEDRDGGGSKARRKGRRRGGAKNVAQLSTSPRSPKEAFDRNTGNARDALFPIDGEVNNCLRLVTEGDARVEHAEDLNDMFSMQRRRRFGETTDWDEQVSTESWDCGD